MDGRFRQMIADARRHDDLYFASLLPRDRIIEAFGKARWFWQGWIYSPAVTVWVFLSQCLSADHSCREAVAGLISWRAAVGLKPCSADTGAYCTARAKIPEAACRQLMQQTGCEVEDEAPEVWQWRGHRVLSVDGSTVTMPDTAANQAVYPQQRAQAPGCGFPIARVVVIFSLAVGTVLDAAIGPYKGKETGENSLFRTLHDNVHADDVVLADRYFSGWFDIALLQQRGAHIVVRKHQLRATDFRRGQRLGKDDQLVQWAKPQRPRWMSRAQHAEMPALLTMREVRVRVPHKGFRTKVLIVVTTLLDPQQYPATEIANLYRRRWDAELNLRSLKTVLEMDHLRCKTPERVRNEFFIHLVGYNLIRRVIALAAITHGKCPWNVSFKGTQQTLNQLLPLLTGGISTAMWCDILLTAIATHHVGNRPNRIEPRVRKRRPKQYKLMQEPRQQWKRRMTA